MLTSQNKISKNWLNFIWCLVIFLWSRVSCVVSDSSDRKTSDEASTSTDQCTSSTRTESTLNSQEGKKRSSHKIGFQTEWTHDRPWLYSTSEQGEDGEERIAMMCRLCKETNNSSESARKRVWVNAGCVTLRKDKVEEHERSHLHQEAIKTRLRQQQMTTGVEKQISSASAAVTDALSKISWEISWESCLIQREHCRRCTTFWTMRARPV